MYASLPIDLGFHPGVIILANISNRVENPDAWGKYRPVIVLAVPDEFGIRPVVAGLTTNPVHSDGHPRIPLEPLGMFDAASYLWSAHPIRLAPYTYQTTARGLLTPGDARAVVDAIAPRSLQSVRRERFLESVEELNARYHQFVVDRNDPPM